MIKIDDTHYIYNDVEEVLTELKTQLAQLGIIRFEKLIKTSNNIQTQCPIHGNGQERKPSCGILMQPKGKLEAGHVNCFACNWSGSFAEMVSICFGYHDFGAFGKRWLFDNFLSTERRKIDFNIVPKEKSEMQYVSEEELDKYRYYHDYLFERGVTKELIDFFDLGYDAETHSVTFPMHDEKGRTEFVAKRDIYSKHFFIPSNVEKPLFGLGELYKLDEFPKRVYVCEGVFDALAWWRVGRPAVALLGLGNKRQVRQLEKLPCKTLALALDNDVAGREALLKLKSRIKTKQCYVVDYPSERKDAGECTDEELKNIIPKWL